MGARPERDSIGEGAFAEVIDHVAVAVADHVAVHVHDDVHVAGGESA